jgi:allantoin racemase
MKKSEPRVAVIIPNTSKEFLAHHRKELSEEFPDIEVTCLDKGPDSVESFIDEVDAGLQLAKLVKEAEMKGFDAVVVSCFTNPALNALREIVSIPVVGAGEAALYVAASLGDKIGILSVLKETIPVTRHMVKGLGLEERVITIRDVGIPVLGLSHAGQVEDKIFDACLKAINEDGAEVLVLGCTGMVGLSERLQERLREKGYDVPVVDPIRAAIYYAKLLVRLGLRQSRISYPKPLPKKRRLDYE